jgi:hypothetical protein
MTYAENRRNRGLTRFAKIEEQISKLCWWGHPAWPTAMQSTRLGGFEGYRDFSTIDQTAKIRFHYFCNFCRAHFSFSFNVKLAKQKTFPVLMPCRYVIDEENGLAWIIHEVSSQKRKDALKGMMNTGFARPAFPFGASIA